MKKSEFKAIVKECVRECLREIMQEQIIQPQLPVVNEKRVLNPMDDDHLRLRNELIKRGAQSNPIVQQTRNAQTSNNAVGAFAVGSSGYTNPSDRIRLAVDKRAFTDPLLDTPVFDAKNAQAQRLANAQRVPMKQDPAVLREILDDTAMTTYAEQLAVGHASPGSLGHDDGVGYAPPADKYAAAVAQSKPEDLFQGSQNWAMLAFEPQRH